MLQELTRELAISKDLREDQIRAAVEELADQFVSAELKADFLCCLASKGETVGEVAAFAQALRERSIKPPIDAETRSRVILDVCGTGGDRLNTFNISTTVSIVCAAAGIAVAKHGNRAITSRAESADVLEALGVRIDLSPSEAARSLREMNFAFFFAPNYHPAFRNIAPARKLCAERGRRTVFNYLGPLLNPAQPSAQLIGVPRPELCEPIARVLQSLGVRRGMVVSGKVEGGSPGSDGPSYLDELSTLGETTIAEFHHERGFAVSAFQLNSLPTVRATLADLAGSDGAGNAETVRGLLRGEDRGPKRDAVLLNAAAALFVAGRVGTITEGWDLAASVIDGGQALNKLRQLC